MRYIILLILFAAALCAQPISTVPAASIHLACAGTPGNTTGVYRQQCQTAVGTWYACNNAGGCTTAGQWVAMGTGAAGPTGPTGPAGNANYACSFTAQTTVVCTHNANTTAVVPSCVDGSGVGFQGAWTVTNANVVTFTFSSAQTGICSISTGGGSTGPTGAAGTNGTNGTNGAAGATGATGPTVYPGAGIPLSTGSAWGTSYTTSGSGTVLALANSPTIVTPVIAQIVPGTDFTLSQNSVNALTSVNSGAVVNTLYLNAGKVGIGAAPSSGKLEVTGPGVLLKLTGTNTASATGGYVSSNGANGLYFGQEGSIAGGAFTGSLANSAYLGTGNSTALQLATNNIVRFTVDNNGQIGINTVTPLTKLNVVETLTTSPRGILSSQFSTDTSGARVGFSKARGTDASPTTVVTADTLGRLMFRGYDGSNFLEMGSIEVAATGTIAATRVPTYMAFSTATNATPSVLTEAMRIHPSSGVSIGNTTDPGASSLGLGSTGTFFDQYGELIAPGNLNHVLGSGTVISNVVLAIITPSGSNGSATPLVVKGHSSQSVDLFQGRNSSNTVLFAIASNGNTLIGGPTDGSYRLDVQKSGSTGTARFYDQTASTGSTLVTITPGAAQTSASTVLSVGGASSFIGPLTENAPSGFSGTLADFQINGVSKVRITSAKIAFDCGSSTTNGGISINSGLLQSTKCDASLGNFGAISYFGTSVGIVGWASGNDPSAALDTGLSRVSAGVIGAGTGAAGSAAGTFRGSYQSSDGTAGATTTCTIVGLTSITVKNGLITGCS